MYIGRSQQEEEKYLQTTIKAINELIEEFDGLSTEQDKEIRKQRKFLWDNRNEFDEFEVLENCSQIALEEKTYANKLNKLKSPSPGNERRAAMFILLSPVSHRQSYKRF